MTKDRKWLVTFDNGTTRIVEAPTRLDAKEYAHHMTGRQIKTIALIH